jgi:argininosuccinate lyase
MRDFNGIDQYIDDEYSKRTDHRFHALGTQPLYYPQKAKFTRDGKIFEGKQPEASQCDASWVICLYRGGEIDRDTASKLLKALWANWESYEGVSGEERILKTLDNNMALASVINYGRTLQEPMSRMKLRNSLLIMLDSILELMQTVHAMALDNLDALMVAHTHMNHGQPMTFGHMLLSVFDCTDRSLVQLEHAYHLVNQNSGGCGSTSGTTWNVDRQVMADLLGMDGVLEATYDCEATQDHTFAALGALSNLAVHISRWSTNFYMFCMDEIDMFKMEPAYCGMSSFMPQKCDSGTHYENIRVFCSNVIGDTFKCMMQLKGEFHGDVLPAAYMPFQTVPDTLKQAYLMIKDFELNIKHMHPNKAKMEKIVRAGYSCATELASYLIKEKGYGGRLAHSIVATMIRQARVKGLKSYECTGEMLDEAAEFINVRKPGLDTAIVQKQLDPAEFLKTHTHLGGAAPEETLRLLNRRAESMADALQRQQERRDQVDNAISKLEKMAKTGNPEG